TWKPAVSLSAPRPSLGLPERGRLIWLLAILLALACVLGLSSWLSIRAAMTATTRDHIFVDPAAVPAERVALVLGAGVDGEDSLSSAAANRVEAAAELYRLGKVHKLLISGDNSSIWYDEVTPMKRRAVALGVPAEDVVLDYAGFRTYDSCYRARAIFRGDRAIVVTQPFPTPRSVYTLEQLGIHTLGLIAREFHGPNWLQSRLREEPAKVLAWLELHLLHPLPTFLGPHEEL